MSTSIGNQNLSEPIIRKKMLTAKNEASCKTVINFGDFGQGVLDEPKEHGGSGKGPSPLHGLLGTLCGCESVTFHRAAKEMNFEYVKPLCLTAALILIIQSFLKSLFFAFLSL